MGEVFLARDQNLNRDVAVKVPLNLHDPGFLKRFLREAQTAARLNHPNICTIYHVGESDGSPFIEMAYIDGESLEDLLTKRLKIRADAFDPREAAELVRDVALAVHEAHEKNIIHRDLKPANIMIVRSGRSYVMDFGLARAADDAGSKLTSAGTVLGTPHYMPIEQFDSEPTIDHRCDIYSLGVIFYQLLTGRLPFLGNNFRAILRALEKYDLEHPSWLRAGIDSDLEAICLKAMAKEAKDRHPSMKELAAEIDHYLRPARGGPAIVSPPATPVEPEKDKPVPAPAPRGVVSFAGGVAGETKRLKLDQIEMALSWCPPGKFTMGSPLGETDRRGNEGLVEVMHTQGFWMCQTEVTQEHYEAVIGKNPSRFKGPKNPVEQVGYTEAVEFASALTMKLRKSGLPSDWELQLPTEAQWEYAARVGTTTAFPFGASLSSKQANFNGDYPYGGAAKGPFLGKTTAVGSYPANAWGLFDTVGNVWEWCLDGYNAKLPGGADPFVSPEAASDRVLRGGSWRDGG